MLIWDIFIHSPYSFVIPAKACPREIVDVNPVLLVIVLIISPIIQKELIMDSRYPIKLGTVGNDRMGSEYKWLSGNGLWQLTQSGRKNYGLSIEIFLSFLFKTFFFRDLRSFVIFNLTPLSFPRTRESSFFSYYPYHSNDNTQGVCYGFPCSRAWQPRKI